MSKVFSTLLILLICMVSASTALAQDEPARLSLEALETETPYFDVSLEPGQSAELTVRLANYGGTAAEALIYTADVYSIHGGGLGIRHHDEPRSGATEWLDFPQETLELQPGDALERTFTVTVPEGVEPGDYISGIVMQDSDPMAVAGGTETEQFHQTVRQGIAVAIDVPGPREPSMTISEASHRESGERSTILVTIENTGNTHLRPEGEFSFSGRSGETLAQSSVAMDTVYAGTNTRLEVTLSDVLPAGEYTILLNLTDQETGASAATDNLTFIVPEAETDEEPTAQPEAAPSGADGTTDTTNRLGSSILIWILGGVSVISAVIAVMGVYYLRDSRRRTRRAPAVVQPVQWIAPSPPPILDARTRPPKPSTPAAKDFGRATQPRPIRQLLPSRRSR